MICFIGGIEIEKAISNSNSKFYIIQKKIKGIKNNHHILEWDKTKILPYNNILKNYNGK